MQEHAIGGVGIAVQAVAENGRSQSAVRNRSGRVNAKLVGSTGLGTKLDPRPSVRTRERSPEGSGGTTFRVTYDLPRTPRPVNREGKIDDAGCFGELAIHHRLIGLTDLPSLELSRDPPIDLLGHGDDHQSAGLDV